MYHHTHHSFTVVKRGVWALFSGRCRRLGGAASFVIWVLHLCLNQQFLLLQHILCNYHRDCLLTCELILMCRLVHVDPILRPSKYRFRSVLSGLPAPAKPPPDKLRNICRVQIGPCNASFSAFRNQGHDAFWRGSLFRNAHPMSR